MSGDYTIYISLFEKPESSHRLLKLAGMLYTGCMDREPSIEYTPEGKPFFPEWPAVCFSLTHSGSWWMCAFGSEPVGLDLQQHQRCERARISQRFFHPEEDEFLRRENYASFFSVWCAKESYLKFIGKGMHTPLSSFSVVRDNALAGETEGAQLRFLPFLPDYSLCLCARQIGEIRMVRDWLHD